MNDTKYKELYDRSNPYDKKDTDNDMDEMLKTFPLKGLDRDSFGETNFNQDDVMAAILTRFPDFPDNVTVYWDEDDGDFAFSGDMDFDGVADWGKSSSISSELLSNDELGANEYTRLVEILFKGTTEIEKYALVLYLREAVQYRLGDSYKKAGTLAASPSSPAVDVESSPQYQTLQATFAALERKIEEQKQELEDAQADLDVATSSLANSTSAHNTKIDAANAIIDAERAKIGILQTEIDRLNLELSTRPPPTDSINQQITNLRGTIVTLTANIGRVRTDLLAEKAKSRTLSTKADQLTALNGQYRADALVLNKRKDKVARDLTDSQREVARLQREVRKHEKTLAAKPTPAATPPSSAASNKPDFAKTIADQYKGYGKDTVDLLLKLQAQSFY